MMDQEEQIVICASSVLDEHAHITMDVDLGDEQVNVLLFRYHGKVYAYRNECVHMVGHLGGESKRLFDIKGEMIRCSKHGILYCPETGVSVSNICHGKQLHSYEVDESDGQIAFVDPRIKAIVSG